MAEKGGEDVKSLEMRVAALEDKLAKSNISEEDMRTFERVAAAMGISPGAGMGAAAAGTQPQLSPQLCTIARSRIVYCWRGPITPTFECTCGPCNPQGGGAGGGFGG